jgi:hypothetical protein
MAGLDHSVELGNGFAGPGILPGSVNRFPYQVSVIVPCNLHDMIIHQFNISWIAIGVEINEPTVWVLNP